MKTKSLMWGLLFAVIVIGGLLLYRGLGRGEGTVAVISVDGEELERVDLSKVRKEYDLEISTEYGNNTVHIEPGAISVTAADCPDHVCMRQGKLTGSGIPIICMPHRLVIEILGGDLDA
ncbi:MAG: NusG domain II-containing protein [Oscillospiraceae bacterium]|nr:NusG domain II-containing protein [Oscillospiraceae bacterium]